MQINHNLFDYEHRESTREEMLKAAELREREAARQREALEAAHRILELREKMGQRATASEGSVRLIGEDSEEQAA